MIVISSGEKWLTSRLIFQQFGPVWTSETPLISCLRPFWSAGRVPVNGGRSGLCVYPGQEKDASLFFAQSSQSRSLGSRKGGRPKSCANIRFGCVQFGKGSHATSRRKMGRDNILFSSPILCKISAVWSDRTAESVTPQWQTSLVWGIGIHTTEQLYFDCPRKSAQEVRGNDSLPSACSSLTL